MNNSYRSYSVIVKNNVSLELHILQISSVCMYYSYLKWMPTYFHRKRELIYLEWPLPLKKKEKKTYATLQTKSISFLYKWNGTL